MCNYLYNPLIFKKYIICWESVEGHLTSIQLLAYIHQNRYNTIIADTNNCKYMLHTYFNLTYFNLLF